MDMRVWASRSTLALGVLLGVLAAPASGQLHEDTRHGFQFKPPKEFNSVAVNTLEETVVAKYQQRDHAGDRNNEFVICFWPAADDAAMKRAHERADGWIQAQLSYFDVVKEKNVKIGRDRTTEAYLEDPNDENASMLYSCRLEQDDGLFLFAGTAAPRRFDKVVRDYSKSVQSFKRIDKVDAEVRNAERSQLDDQERFLAQQIDKLPPGWDSLRTDRYLFLFNADKGFVKEMADRIESMRDVYEELYPQDEPFDDVSIVRVCNSVEEYYAYGGRPGSGGYWHPTHKELVFFDFRPRTLTMAVLNHEAFHQYIYYFYGELSPHSWYNEGHGDYFAGADMTSSHRIKSYGDAPGGVGRRMTVKEACRLRAAGETHHRDAATPLRDLMRYSQSEYYARSGVHYAQGWALVHMLRESKGLQPKWRRILPEYLDNLLAAREEVAQQVMEEMRKAAELQEKGSSEEMSDDPADYYALADTGAIQDLAYEKTFADWSDEDWEEFDAYYLAYVEKL